MTQLRQGLIFYFEWGEITLSTKVSLDIFISIEACHQNNVRKSPQLSAFWNSSITLSNPLQEIVLTAYWNFVSPKTSLMIISSELVPRLFDPRVCLLSYYQICWSSWSRCILCFSAYHARLPIPNTHQNIKFAGCSCLLQRQLLGWSSWYKKFLGD